MGNQLIASYRLVYFQPDPEDGERVCVALLFYTEREVELLYDPKFPKVVCLTSKANCDLIRVYLDDLKMYLKSHLSDIDSHILRYAPHLVMSEVRKSVWPLSDRARLYLMRRFLSKDKRVAPDQMVKEGNVKTHIRDVVKNATRDHIEHLIKEDVSSQWVLGEKVPQIRPVAFALDRNNRIILIDGTDLTVLTPILARRRANDVALTFWQYRQYGQTQGYRLDRKPLFKIGVVINGTRTSQPSYKDTHDFVMHQFGEEADLAIDAASDRGLDTLKEALS